MPSTSVIVAPSAAVDAHRERIEVEDRSGVAARHHRCRLERQPGAVRPAVAVALMCPAQGVGDIDRRRGSSFGPMASHAATIREHRRRDRAPARARNRARRVPPVGGEGFGSDSEAGGTGSLLDPCVTPSGPTRSSRGSSGKAREDFAARSSHRPSAPGPSRRPAAVTTRRSLTGRMPAWTTTTSPRTS